MKESSVVYIEDKGKIIDYNMGTPISVEFNFERVWKYFKDSEGNKLLNTLHFVHIHPPGINCC